ncbi:MAG: TonB-dependent receptor [Porphyromonas sp.]|nr:TonB-dependent receptor [Porphyromonas sp.]
MKKIASIFLSLLFVSACPLRVLAANDGTTETDRKHPSDANIVGHVVEAATGEHLPGITITIKGTTFGTVTDRTGHFFIRNLKPGKVVLEMRGLGYKSQQKEVVVEKDKVIEVNFEAVIDNINLDEVVVSSNRQTTLRRLAPTLVNVLNDEVFDRANANNLAQGLVFQPGVRVENNCQNCGFNQVRINGLDGRYTQILIDSRPIMSALAGVYGLEQIPTNMIDRVEVVRGGGSALFGSSAIAGVVNIITKEPTSNRVSFTESLAYTGMKQPDNNMGFNASMVSDSGKAGAMVFGQARKRHEWDANGDHFSEIGAIDARSLGAHLYLRTSDVSKISGEVHTISEARRGGDNLDWPEHVAAVAESVNHSIYSGNIKYDLFSTNYKHHLQAYASGQHVLRKSYYGGVEDWDENWGKLGNPVPKEKYGDNYGVTNGNTYNIGAQYTYDFEHFLFMPAQILAGVEYTYDHLVDKMPVRAWEKTDGGKEESKFPTLDQQIRNWSQFAQIEWKSDKFNLLLGSRFDQHSAVDKPIFSPRVTMRYAPIPLLNIRASYAKGFRAPQVFDEDLHVGVVGGEAQKVVNHKNLTPEISHAFNLSVDTYFSIGDEAQANVMVEGFYNRLKDVFTNKMQPSLGDGIKRYMRINGDGAKVLGANIEGRIAYKWLQLQAGLTLTSSKFDQPEEWGRRATFDASGNPVMTEQPTTDEATGEEVKKMQYNVAQTSDRMPRTPSVYGYFTIGINPVKPLNIALTGTYTGKMYIPHAIIYGDGAAVSDEGHKAFENLPKDETNSNEIHIDELQETKSFFDFGAKVSYDLKLSRTMDFQLFVGMNNIFNAFQSDFDKGATRDSGYMYGPTMPRTVYSGVKLSF